jgi:anti-sigma factor RsiW
MTRKPDPVGELEIDAYLNDQLDLAGRIAVEESLARNPVLAARVMEDLRIRDALQATLRGTPVAPGQGTLLAARRLQRGLGMTQLGRGARRVGLAAACVALGWLVHWQVNSFGISTTEAAGLPPRFTVEALQAHRTSMLRAAMASQLEAPQFDRDEILRNTAIALPDFPRDWTVLDVQVYPSTLGPSVVVMFTMPDSGPLSLYMARSGTGLSTPLHIIGRGEKLTAYWRKGGLSVALTGQDEPALLRHAAAALMKRLITEG